MESRISELEARLAQAQAELAKARKNSGNSSKPPSSDLVKPKPASASKKNAKRKRGAQPGHPRHERPAFDESQVDTFWDYTWPACPDCGGAVEPTVEPPRVIQQIELVAMPVEISEHRAQA